MSYLLVQLVTRRLEVCKAQGSFHSEHSGLLRSEGELAIRYLRHESRLRHRSHLRYFAVDATEDEEQQVDEHSDQKPGVDVQENDGDKWDDPEEGVQLGLGVELGEVVNLEEHAFQCHHDNGAQDSLKEII